MHILFDVDFLKFETGPNDINRRIDKVVRIFCPDINLSAIYKYIRKGLIKVNNKKTSSDYRITDGDVISIAEFILSGSETEPQKLNSSNTFDKKIPELQIIFRNKDLLAINKPYNYVVHGNSNDNSVNLEQIIKSQYSTDNKSLAFTPGPLHRLDKKTTGLLFFSQSIEGARWFSENLQKHTIQKIYIGIVQGKLNQKQIWIDDIAKDTVDNSSENKNTFHTVSIKHTENSKTAETEATPLFYGKYKGKDITIVEFYIKTGRTHQIRSQTSIHGFPLIGDTAYSGIPLENESRSFYLHARKIIFTNKIENLDLPEEIICNLDKDFVAFISKTCDKNNLEL